MIMSAISAHRALELWQEAGLLGEDKADELRRHLARHPEYEGQSRFVTVFSAIGAVLAGLGLVLLVASHWDGIGPTMRIALLFAAYGLVVMFALTARRSGYSRVEASLWLMASLTVGANIFLIGQIFNFSLTYWQGPFIWMIAVLTMAWATRSSLQAWLAIPLALLALAWFGGGKGWFTDDQMAALFSASGLRPMLPILGLSLASIGLLVRRSDNWRFAARTWIAWGAMLAAVPLIIGSFHPRVFLWMLEIDLNSKHWVIIVASVVLLAAALIFGDFRARHSGLGLTFLAMVLYLLIVIGVVEPDTKAARGLLYIGYVIIVFVMAMVVVWVGTASREKSLVNIGIGAMSVFILGQYFSWSLQLLDRAAAFIIGGILLIGIAWWAERQRRRLLQEMAQ
jgi:uncharacterized membrane protein